MEDPDLQLRPQGRLDAFAAGIRWDSLASCSAGEPETSSSSGTLFPVLASREREKLGLYLRTRAGAVQFVAIDATPQCEAGVPRALTPQRETLRPSANSKRGNRRNALSKTH